MNEQFQLLENIASFLEQGYLIQDILKICGAIFKADEVNLLTDYLNEGLSLDEAIIKCNFNQTFIEYFKFFRNKNNYSRAILQSLEICKTKIRLLKK